MIHFYRNNVVGIYFGRTLGVIFVMFSSGILKNVKKNFKNFLINPRVNFWRDSGVNYQMSLRQISWKNSRRNAWSFFFINSSQFLEKTFGIIIEENLGRIYGGIFGRNVEHLIDKISWKTSKRISEFV